MRSQGMGYLLLYRVNSKRSWSQRYSTFLEESNRTRFGLPSQIKTWCLSLELANQHPSHPLGLIDASDVKLWHDLSTISPFVCFLSSLWNVYKMTYESNRHDSLSINMVKNPYGLTTFCYSQLSDFLTGVKLNFIHPSSWSSFHTCKASYLPIHSGPIPPATQRLDNRDWSK